MLTGSHFRLNATEVVPLDSPGDISDELAQNRSKGELVAGLQSLGRKGAMNAIEFGYAAEVAMMLKHQDTEVITAACEALGNMGEAAAAYVNDVAAHLTSSSGDVRAAAATATGLLGPVASSQHIEALKEMMSKDKAENAKCAAIGALGAMGAGDQAAPIAGLLSSQSPAVVAAAIQALGELGSDGVAEAEGVAKKLDDAPVRYAAMCSLLNLGEATIEKYMDKIIAKGLADPDSLTRTAAAEALGKIPAAVTKTNANIGKIAKYLKDEHPGVRCSAALALGYLGEKAAGQAESIKALLQDPAEDTSELYLTVGGGCPRSPPASRRPMCAALVALGMLGAEAMANDCAECLSSDEWEVKMCALECLAQLGEAAKEQSSKISACLEDEVFIIRARACDCLGAVKAEDGVHNLPDLLDDKAPSVRSAALLALAECPEVAQSYSNEVFKCMGDSIASVSAAAICCLGSMGDTGRSYASIIATKLYDEDSAVRAAACEALGKLGDHGAAFAEEVAANLQDDAPEVRMKAARALGKMGEEGAAFISDLGFLTQDVFGEVSMAATDAISALEKF